MDITPIVPDKAQQVQRYGGGAFVISGDEYRGAVLVTSGQTVPWQAMQGHQTLTDTALAELAALAGAHEIVIVGTGPKFQLLPMAFRQQIKSLGASVDAMDTGAACRTYNILMSEGRKVLAALIAV